MPGWTLPSVSMARERTVCSPRGRSRPGERPERPGEPARPARRLAAEVGRQPGPVVDLNVDAGDRRAPRGAHDAVPALAAGHLGGRRLEPILPPPPEPPDRLPAPPPPL